MKNIKWSDLIIIVMGVFLILVVCLPYAVIDGKRILTYTIDITQYNELGDFVGGITAPFIGIIGAMLVYRSFRAQEQANKFQFEALHQQREHEMLFSIYQEFKNDCLFFKELMNARGQPTAITNDDRFYNEITAGNYSKPTKELINGLKGLVFHIWSFYDPIKIKLEAKPYGKKISDSSTFILLNKFLNVYENYLEDVFIKVVEIDPSGSVGQVLKSDIDGALRDIDKMKSWAIYSS